MSTLLIIKPRITRCSMTGHWIVNSGGSRHTCGGSTHLSDEGFRRFSDALTQANMLAQERYGREAKRSDWCNCQAIRGTANFPGPWHPKGDPIGCWHYGTDVTPA